MIGRKGMIGPVPLMPSGPASQPHWKTATVIPMAAPKLSRLVIAAVSGTTSEWNSRVRARKPRPTTTSRKIGSASVSTLVKSLVMACAPPT